MNTRWLLHPAAIAATLLAYVLLLWVAIARSEPDGCVYNRPTFEAIRHQSRLARQAGRHSKADVLDYAAAILRCQTEELERVLAEAMSEVWNEHHEERTNHGQ